MDILDQIRTELADAGDPAAAAAGEIRELLAADS
jgi:hypothetical protein